MLESLAYRELLYRLPAEEVTDPLLFSTPTKTDQFGLLSGKETHCPFYSGTCGGLAGLFPRAALVLGMFTSTASHQPYGALLSWGFLALFTAGHMRR